MPKFELIVDRILDDGRLVVTNNSSDDIPVGTVFTLAFWTYAEIEHGEFQNRENGVIGDVALRLDSAEVLRKNFENIPKGYSAAAQMVGAGTEIVLQRLKSRKKGELVLLGAE
jgi:hypothetical protein